ncbi:MAG: DUF4212 domain-containing protein [Chromatiales bacterium]|nr:MAG: DUF4212 domain-containing protein [Chromatiales bacterium]
MEREVYQHKGDNLPRPGEHSQEVLSEATVHRYWRANLRLVIGLLLLWFVVSFGFGILLVEPLNRIPFFGFKLGFWWAQQGAIYVFVAIIFIYVILASRIDRKFGVDDREPPPE